MLPIRHKSIFKSRWIALLWAGGILWTAVEFAGGQSTGNAAGNEDMAAAQSVVNTLDGFR
jgi:hypothetical protein